MIKLDQYRDTWLSEKIKYLKEVDWNYVLNNSKPINNSIEYLNQMDPSKTVILTKIHSLENEGTTKIEWARKQGIKQNIILVPYNSKKANVIVPEGNILIDDCLKNLDERKELKGDVLFFNKDNNGFDSWHDYNDRGYKSIEDLSSYIN